LATTKKIIKALGYADLGDFGASVEIGVESLLGGFED
jgi:hypothetical protein